VSSFLRRVAAIAGVDEGRIERLSGGDLSEVLLVRRGDGRLSVAKGGTAVPSEAAMLRALAAAGVPAPLVEGEWEGALFLEHVVNDKVFSPSAWADAGAVLRRLHSQEGDSYGWPVDYQIGSVRLDNRQGSDWPRFWGEQRLVATASVLDRPWRERVERVTGGLRDLLPPSPRAALLHGDLWSGNILVAEGRVAALIDPACCYGDPEVDIAMLTLFDPPPEDFWDAYGTLQPGWRERRALYQLFPALVHLRLFGQSYAGMADRILTALGA
jgi:fructosamine-3-kinase